MDIKSQLYSYYLDLISQISSCSQNSNQNLDYQNLTISDIIMNIKEATIQLINDKVSQITSLNKNSNNYYQLENYTKNIENNLRIYLRLYFEYKIQNDALEEKIRIYRIMQQDFEDLKEKVKYEGGRFLNNERKENEILILRQENDILKKEISKLERNNKLNDILNKDYLNKIKNLEKEIELLKKKINEYQELNNKKNENNESVKNNNNNDNTLTKWFNKHDIENVNSIIPNSLSKKKKFKLFNKFKKYFSKKYINK